MPGDATGEKNARHCNKKEKNAVKEKNVNLQCIMHTPEPIQKAMEDWRNDYASHVEYLGEYQGKNAYTYCFEEDGFGIGFPYLVVNCLKREH